ncbi:zinc uptake protein ZrgA [Thaumasiovibrio subtropicus]|uniref:zinc uptake protein ZrgA n=1 Tax=Thaumasiovibrio subtropicus TaxID=1891207 RepID=UPI000B35CC84|nr:DUF2796 domain-containing protein [Thaumasiovibrio subtropicus]
MKKTALTFALMAALPLMTQAESYREHGAHVHGVVELNMAQDGQQLLIEVTAPGADVVGFEHAPQNADQKAQVESATATLNDAAKLFAFSTPCNLIEAAVSNTLEADKHDGHDHHDHDHHDHDDHKGHDHHDHDDHKGHDHHDHDHHDHDDHKGHDHHDHDHHDHDDHKGHDHHDHDHNHGHGEFSAQYVFECADINALQYVDVHWFERFSATEKMTVQAITDKGQFADTLDANKHRIQF